MGSAAERAWVLGGGVIGLTTALRLREAGVRVTLRTASRWTETVSNVAAAIWYPFRAYPVERVSAWAARTFEAFAALTREPEAGVVMQSGRVLWNGTDEDPGLSGVPSPVRPIPAGALPAGYELGAETSVPRVEMPIYLGWLERRFREAGGVVESGHVPSLDAALEACPVVVNCTGLGALELAGDPTLLPIRGQVVLVENPGLDRFTLDAGGHAEEITYVIPRSRDVVLGGTATPGSWDLEPDPEVGRRIRERCEALEPALRGARVIGHAVGLRPGRPAVRLERETRPGGTVIHNYGHGGSGVTVSWGCAEEVLRLLGRDG